MRFITKILSSFAVLVALSSSAVAAPNLSITLEAVWANYLGITDGSIVLDANGGGLFTDTQDCLGFGLPNISLAVIKATDPDFKQMYAIALAALLAGKVIDVEISNTGSGPIDCMDIGGYGIPVITAIGVRK